MNLSQAKADDAKRRNRVPDMADQRKVSAASASTG